MTVAAMQMADMKVCARRSSRVWIRRPLSRRDGRLVRAFVPDHSKSPVRSMRRSGSLAMRLMTDGGNVYRIHIDGEEADLEHELFISGIGGQGIQLMGKVLALGAIAENLFVQLTGEYGGAMRGGSTIANVVIGAERLRALPVVSEGGAALLMHDKFVDEALLPKLRPGSLIVAESSIVDHLHGVEGHELIAVPGKEIALQIGNAQSTGLVMLGAYCAITGLVRVESLITAMKQVVPSYRRQHVEANEKALRAGDEAAPRLAAPVTFDRAAA